MTLKGPKQPPADGDLSPAGSAADPVQDTAARLHAQAASGRKEGQL